jgi:uncharacterized protein (DUF2252 family)
MFTVRDGKLRGRALREKMPRVAHAELTLPERDPVAIIEEQNASRLSDLVPVRMGRMLQSPFTYYRGTAGVMAHDLSVAEVTGQKVVVCGDAHISNFGMYASPERRLLFDLNDFDEAAIAPWEWDVKRLAASVIVGGRDLGLTEEQCREAAMSAVRTYRQTVQYMFELTGLERYYFQVETDWIETLVQSKDRKVIRGAVEKSKLRTSEQARDKLMSVTEDGILRFREFPPTTIHVDLPTLEGVQELFFAYCSTLRSDAAYLLTQYRLVDFVRRAVGVGSVGTSCFVVMLEGPSEGPLFLQVKEAPPSVLETYGRQVHEVPRGVTPSMHGIHGHRVVTGQRILQAQSDPFLGWTAGWANPERPRPADYYWRQFRDMKGSVRLDRLPKTLFANYVGLCGQLLGRAHSQSPGGAVVAGYLGQSSRFDEAIVTWSVAYADQSEKDFDALAAAVKAGRLPAEFGA